MLKMLFSSAISALAVFVMMSYGAAERTNATQGFRERNDAEIVLRDVEKDLAVLVDFIGLSLSEMKSKDYSTQFSEMADPVEVSNAPLSLRNLVFSKLAAARSCAFVAEWLNGFDVNGEDESSTKPVVAMVAYTHCVESVNKAISLMLDNGAEYNIDMVAPKN